MSLAPVIVGHPHEMSRRRDDLLTSEERAAKRRKPRGGACLKADTSTTLVNFKSRLKTSTLPDEAAAAEEKRRSQEAAVIEKALGASTNQKLKDMQTKLAELEAEEAADKLRNASKRQKKRGVVEEKKEGGGWCTEVAKGAVDPDKRLTFADIWQEGEEESSTDWLRGSGLKFHTTADRAYEMAEKRFKESVETCDPLENRELAAQANKRRGELLVERRKATWSNAKGGKA